MGTVVVEWYGYRPSDVSENALEAAATKTCPFIDGECVKTSGVCSLSATEDPTPVIICPVRMYGGNHRFLREIAADAFSQFEPQLGPDGLPEIVSGSLAVPRARLNGRPQVGVFGQRWDTEVKLPAGSDGMGSYSVDFTLILVDAAGELRAFAPVEVQTIDTTNNVGASVEALHRDRSIAVSGAGFNWENVNKRILPQLIMKGLMLQAERLCQMGIYFVAPVPVVQRILRRLGGEKRLREIPKQPGSISFWGYHHSSQPVDGLPVDLDVAYLRTISTSDLSIAFITPENLPPGGSYEMKLRARLK
ncbi:restriction endonuclease [Agrococcus lahaulensis]|nr:restriction endonuclease [Agrococcus lahaulensis]